MCHVLKTLQCEWSVRCAVSLFFHSAILFRDAMNGPCDVDISMLLELSGSHLD